MIHNERTGYLSLHKKRAELFMKKRYLEFVFVTCLTVTGYSYAGTEWSADEASQFTQGCVSSFVMSARKGYYNRAEEAGNKNPQPFPEGKTTEAVAPMCDCILQQLQDAGISVEEAGNQSDAVQRLMISAVQGGKCKLGGAFGDAINQKLEHSVDDAQ